MGDELLNLPGPHTIFHLYVSDYHWLVWRYFWHIAFRLAVFSCSCSVLSNMLPHEAAVINWTRRFGWAQRPTCLAYRALVDLVAGFSFNFRAHLPSLDLELMGFRVRRRHKHYGWYDRRRAKSARARRRRHQDQPSGARKR